MKKYLLGILLIGFTNVSAQFDLGTGMGLAFFSSSDMNDYVSSMVKLTKEPNTFNSSADFFIELGYNISNKYQVALEYNFNIYSINSPSDLGIYNLSINRHKPTLIGYYVIPGVGYKFKLGVGFGIRMLQAEETIYLPIKHSTTGIGFLLKAQGDTKLSNNFYALIAGELRYDLPGKIKTLNNNKATIGFNSISIGLKLGMSYYF